VADEDDETLVTERALPMPRTESSELKTIPAADDDIEILILLKLMLEGRGYRALPAHHGERVTRLLRTDVPVDLLLTNIVVSGMNGMDVARGCLALRPRLPVVFMSTLVDERALRLKVWGDAFLLDRSIPFVARICDLFAATALPLSTARTTSSIH
jgi:CheY-like chemotaxis protein